MKPETVAQITQEGQDARDDFAPLKAESRAASIGEFGGKLAPCLAIPAGTPEGLVARITAGAATGGAMGGLDFVPPGESRTVHAATGAVLGGAGAAALAGLGKVYNAAAKNPLSGMVNQKLSDRFKIPTTLSELTGGSSRTDSVMEQVPSVFGIKGFLQNQQQAAKDAATAHFGKYVIDPALDSTAEMKIANDAHLDSLYQKVRANAAHLPQAAAPEVKQAAGELLDRYPGVFDSIQDTHIKRILKNIQGDTATKAVGVGVLDAAGNPITRQVEPKFSFDDLWTLRKGLGKEIGDASTDTARGQLSALYSAVSTDMDGMLSGKGGEALQDFRTANDAFKQYSVKFDAMRQAYDRAMGTTGAGNMGFFSPQKYGTALKNLANDPKYKRNVRWTPGEIEEMTGLANILQVTERAGQFMENPPTGNRWGMPSGATAAGGGSFLAGGAAATAQTAGASAMAALVTKFLTTTQAGKRLALAASKVQPSSRAMEVILRQLYDQAPKVAAEVGIGSPNQTEPAEQPPSFDMPEKWKTIGE